MTRPLAFSPTAAAPLNPAALNSAALNSAALNPSPLNPAFSGVGGASPAQGITDALPLHDVNDRPIGELLKESVSLSAEQSAAIAKHMRANGIRYGEAAVALGLVSRDQVLQALARQFRYPFANPEARHRLGSELVVLNQPFTHAAEAIRALRSQLLMRVFNAPHPPQALAIISPEPLDGKSHLCANLAASLAQMGRRVLLIDADLRGPRQHQIFKLSNAVGLSGLLGGRNQGSGIQSVNGLPGLQVLPGGPRPPNPLELLERAGFAQLLADLSPDYDHVLVDTPAAALGADAQVIARQCGSALLVARQDASRVAALQALVNELSDSPAQLAGVVLNTH